MAATYRGEFFRDIVDREIGSIIVDLSSLYVGGNLCYRRRIVRRKTFQTASPRGC